MTTKGIDRRSSAVLSRVLLGATIFLSWVLWMMFARFVPANAGILAALNAPLPWLTRIVIGTPLWLIGALLLVLVVGLIVVQLTDWSTKAVLWMTGCVTAVLFLLIPLVWFSLWQPIKTIIQQMGGP